MVCSLHLDLQNLTLALDCAGIQNPLKLKFKMTSWLLSSAFWLWCPLLLLVSFHFSPPTCLTN